MRFWTWLIVRLLVAGVLLGWLFSALLLRDSGEKEFRRSLEALKKVNSIHYAMVADAPTQHTEEQADLVCSDDSFHRKTHIVAHQQDRVFNIDREILGSGGQEYELLSNGMWKRGGAGLEPAQVTCKRLAQGSRAWIVPDFDEMVAYSVIEKGEKKTVNGEVCREWKVSTRAAGYGRQTLCLGIVDHLPREVVTFGTGARFTYAFNTPIEIEAPAAETIAPEPEPNPYRPPPPGLTLSDDNDAN
jgi:hypothetical protein